MSTVEVLDKEILIREAQLLVKATENELITIFGKSNLEAERLVTQVGLEAYVLSNPIALHDSVNSWAIRVLTEVKDYKAVERYLVE